MSLANRSSVNSLRMLQLQPIAEDEETPPPPPAIPPKSRRRSSVGNLPEGFLLEPTLFPARPSPLQSHPPAGAAQQGQQGQLRTPRTSPARYRSGSPRVSSPGSAGGSARRVGGVGGVGGDGSRPSPSLPPPQPAAYKPFPFEKDSEPSVSQRESVKEGESSRVKENEWFTRRGGWLRLGAMGCLFVLIVVGLAVGLTIGIRKKNQDTDDQSNPAASISDVFPAGSFAFTAALTQVQADCTSNPDTWRCYPYQTYSDSAIDSGATFFWIISRTSPGSSTYTISSTENPFSPRFDNVSLSLLDENKYAERFSFEFAMNKTALTASPIPVPASSNSSTSADDDENGSGGETKQANCKFAETMFAATIWTRMPPEMATGLNVSTPDFDQKFGTWPGQVEIWQKTDGGPECKGLDGGGIPVEAGGGECSCRYANYDLEGGKR